jgi:hypothetical protein
MPLWLEWPKEKRSFKALVAAQEEKTGEERKATVSKARPAKKTKLFALSSKK